MAIVRCGKGHYYDDQKFSRCPHCGIFANLEDSAGVTVAFRDIGTRADTDQKTIGRYSARRGNDYVTGWLVCVKGPEKGRDYRLHHGFNKVGRGYDMNICITEDPAVSRENHCSIVYDHKQNMFSAVPGAGTLTYVNGKLLEKPEAIKTGDKIQIGGSELEFVPFCREGRIWEDG